MKWFGVKKNSLKWWSTGSEGELDRNENKRKTTTFFFFFKKNRVQRAAVRKTDERRRDFTKEEKKKPNQKKEKKTDKKKKEMISRRTYDAEGGRGAGAQRQFGRRLAPRPGQTVGRAAQRLRRRPGHSRVAARAAEQRTRKKKQTKRCFF